jgi:hypothetical protein
MFKNILIIIIILLSVCLIQNIAYETFENKKTNNRKIKIFQTSPPHTGSTVLVNYIYGLFCPKESVNDKTKPNFWIKKSHDLNLDKIMQENAEFECYFIMSERNDAKVHNLIKQKYRKYSNVLIFKYDEIKDTTNDILLPKITNNVFNKIKHFLPDELITHDDICKKNMQKRIKDMNKKYEEIKDKPFSYFDTFYHIHGSHKNR